jgi:hypothetical protein
MPHTIPESTLLVENGGNSLIFQAFGDGRIFSVSDWGRRYGIITALGSLFKHMHPNEQVYVGNIIGVHVKPAQFPICLTEQLKYLHVVDRPLPVDKCWLETFIITLINVLA